MDLNTSSSNQPSSSTNPKPSNNNNNNNNNGNIKKTVNKPVNSSESNIPTPHQTNNNNNLVKPFKIHLNKNNNGTPRLNQPTKPNESPMLNQTTDKSNKKPGTQPEEVELGEIIRPKSSLAESINQASSSSSSSSTGSSEQVPKLSIKPFNKLPSSSSIPKPNDNSKLNESLLKDKFKKSKSNVNPQQLTPTNQQVQQQQQQLGQHLLQQLASNSASQIPPPLTPEQIPAFLFLQSLKAQGLPISFPNPISPSPNISDLNNKKRKFGEFHGEETGDLMSHSSFQHQQHQQQKTNPPKQKQMKSDFQSMMMNNGQNDFGENSMSNEMGYDFDQPQLDLKRTLSEIAVGHASFDSSQLIDVVAASKFIKNSQQQQHQHGQAQAKLNSKSSKIMFDKPNMNNSNSMPKSNSMKSNDSNSFEPIRVKIQQPSSNNGNSSSQKPKKPSMLPSRPSISPQDSDTIFTPTITMNTPSSMNKKQNHHDPSGLTPSNVNRQTTKSPSFSKSNNTGQPFQSQSSASSSSSKSSISPNNMKTESSNSHKASMLSSGAPKQQSNPELMSKSATMKIVSKVVQVNHSASSQICPGCNKPDDSGPMICCDSCDDWYHW
jgi:hypothetical protein